MSGTSRKVVRLDSTITALSDDLARPVLRERVLGEEDGHGFLARHQCEQYPNRERPRLQLRLLRRDLVAAKTDRRIKAVGYFPIVAAGDARWLAGRESCLTCWQRRLGAPLSRLRVTSCHRRRAMRWRLPIAGRAVGLLLLGHAGPGSFHPTPARMEVPAR